jgi:predicted nucleic acid-binding protein
MKYFIDTNIIIDVFERKNIDAQNKLKVILENDENEIFYNGLIYTETLRVILNNTLFNALKSSFKLFTWIDIDKSIYIETKKFSRYCRSKNIKVAKGKCELIDMIHFITAKHNNLEIITKDTDDFKRLEKAYQEFSKIKEEDIKKSNSSSLI